MPRKSTNVRFPPIPRWLAATMPTVARLSPALAGRLALRVFETPPPPRPARRSERLRSDVLPTRDGPIVRYTAGHGRPVYLVHGWGGRASQLDAFVGPILNAGLAAVTFDAPAHGSSPGRRTSLPAFARVLDALTAQHGPPAGFIAHSFGCAVVAYQLAERWPGCPAVFVAPMVRPRSQFDAFTAALGLPAALRQALPARAERRFRISWQAIDGVARGPSHRSPLLVVHDHDDVRIPMAEAEALAAAWPEARLERTHGLGHNRVLASEAIARDAVAFLCRQQRRPASAGADHESPAEGTTS